MTPTIIATSGGSFGEHRDTYIDCDLPAGTEHYPQQTTPIDELILRASGQQSPRICCLMTASDDLVHNVSMLEGGLTKRFGGLGAKVETLRLNYYAPDDAQVKAQIEAADIIYVSGGNSYILNKTLRQRGVDKLLAAAAKKGTVLSGLSAGLCCWFSELSASNHNGAVVSVTDGLGWLKAFVAVHWDTHPFRHKHFHQALIDNPGLVGLTFDECTAIEVRGNAYRLHQFATGGQVCRGQYDGASGHYSFEPLEITPDLKPLSELGIESLSGLS